MRLREVGPEANGLPITSYRLVQPTTILEDVAQVVVRLQEVGPEADGLPVTGHCLVPAVQGIQDQPQVRVEVRVLGTDRQRLLDVVESQRVPAGLDRQQAQQVQRVGVGRVNLQHLLIQGLRLLPLPSLVGLHGPRKRIGYV